eukprot:7158024-Ditylum_brightwellii.AAC.1
MKSLVMGRKSNEVDDQEHDTYVSGTWHNLPIELQTASILVSKRDAARKQNNFDEVLEQQWVAREEKLADKQEKDLGTAEKALIQAS